MREGIYKKLVEIVSDLLDAHLLKYSYLREAYVSSKKLLREQELLVVLGKGLIGWGSSCQAEKMGEWKSTDSLKGSPLPSSCFSPVSS